MIVVVVDRGDRRFWCSEARYEAMEAPVMEAPRGDSDGVRSVVEGQMVLHDEMIVAFDFVVDLLCDLDRFAIVVVFM